jgi:hypothetical protein
MKIKKVFPDNPEYSDMLMFRCPACGGNHMISIGPKSYWNIRWQFNGDYNKPTINPSVLVTHEIPADVKIEPDIRRCHSFIRDGKIEFLSDCTHHLAGQTVELPDFPEDTPNGDNIR